MADSGTGFDAFISYSHALDGEFGPALRKGIEQYARPWYRPRRRRVFIDNGNLAVNADLWQSIAEALGRSRYFLLLASPQSAASPWVEREVRWWLEHRSAETLLVLLTDGEFVWDREREAVDGTETTALPPVLVSSMRTAPRLVNLREIRKVGLALKNPTWQSSLADIVATIDGVEKDTLVGDHLRQGRRTRRLVTGVVVVLVALLVAASVLGLAAMNQRDVAQTQTLVATSRQLVAQAATIRDARPNLARQLLAQAYRLSPTPEVLGAVLASPSIPTVIPTKGLAWTVAYSPGRSLLAIGSDEGVTLRTAPSSTPLATIDGIGGYVHGLAFSADDRWLAVGGFDGAVLIFDVRDPAAPVRTGSFHLPPEWHAWALAFVPGTPALVVISSNGAFMIWDITEPAAPRELSSAPGAATTSTADLAVSPDGRLLAVTGSESTVVLRDISNPRDPVVVGTISGHTGTVGALEFSPRGGTLVSGGADDTTRLWDVSDPAHPKPYGTLTGQSLSIESVAFAPDGAGVASGAGDGTIWFWNVADPIRPKFVAVLTGHTDRVRGLAFSPDSHTLASASADGPNESTPDNPRPDGSVRLWNVASAVRSAAAAVVPGTGGGKPAFRSDGRILAAGFPTALWDLTSMAAPRRVATVSTFNMGGQAVAFSPDGRRLGSGNPVVFWDTSDPSQPRELNPDTVRTDGATDVVFDPTGRLVATSESVADYQLWFVDGDRTTKAGTLPGSAHSGGSLAFSPDGIVASGKDSLQLWDVRDAAHPALLSSSPAGIASLVFGPGGATVYTGNSAGEITSWDVRDPRRPSVLATTRGHTGPVSSLAIAPAGDTLASASDNGRVWMWSLRDPARPAELTVFDAGGPFSAELAFSPDGSILAGSGQDSLILWDVSIDRLLRQMCADSPAISDVEWARYLPDLPYDPPCS